MFKTEDILQAVFLFQSGNYERADLLAARILTENPRVAEALLIRGVVAGIRGSHDEAESYFLRLIRVENSNHYAFYNLAKSISAQGRDAEAIKWHKKAIGLNSSNAEAFLNYGESLLKLGQVDAALGAFDKAISLKNDMAEALNNRGICLSRKGERGGALLAYRQALNFNPHLSAVWNNMAVVYHDLNLHKDAITCCDEAIKLDPTRSDHWTNKGAALAGLGQFEEALDCYDKALSLDNQDSKAWLNKGNALLDLRRYSDAIESYERALKLRPEARYVLGSLLQAQITICNWSNIETRLQLVESSLRRGLAVSQPFTLLSLFDSPKLHKLTAEMYVMGVRPCSLPIGVRVEGGRIRLGYFSADFREHPVTHLIRDLIRLHSRDSFEVIAFSMGPFIKDGMRDYLEAVFDEFIDVSQLSDSDVVELARMKAIDIAVDLGGHTHNSRPQIFIDRVAPIQINYLGYPSTWGHPCIDYLMADDVVVTERNRKFFTENIIYLPSCFQPNPIERIIGTVNGREYYGLPPSGFIYCCFNNAYKITRRMVATWARILILVPDSVLWLFSYEEVAAQNLRAEFLSCGVESSRLVFAKRLERFEDHIARYKVADLFLDTFPYGAHTTASDALWAGLPVLTQAGESFASRVGASLLRAAALDQMVVRSEDDYVDLAVELSRNTGKTLQIRAHLEENRNGLKLFETKNLVRSVEAGYRRALENHLIGKKLSDIWLTDENTNSAQHPQ